MSKRRRKSFHDSAVQAPESAAPKQAEKAVQTVPFDVFARVSGAKFDQLAAFGSYIRRQGVGRMSVKAWHEAYQTFLRTPVKGA